MNAKSTIARTIRTGKYLNFRNAHLLPIGLPLLMGLAMGPLLAFLIVSQNWLVACALAFLVPAGILFNRYPFVAIMIWMLLIPFLPNGRVSPYIYWILHRSLIPLALGITVLSYMLRLKSRRPLQLGRAELATIIYTAIAITSILVTRPGDPLQTIYAFYDRNFVGLAAYWLMRFFGPSEKDLKRLIPVMLALCLAESVIGLMSWFVPQALPAIWDFKLTGFRVVGTLGDPAPYTSTLMFMMLFLLHYAMNRPKRIVRGVLLSAVGLGMFCIFLSFSRGSWLAGALTLVALLFLYPKPILTLALITLPVIIGLSTTVLANEVAYASQRLNTENTVESRLILAHAGEQMFLAKPLLGWGYGNYDRYDWRFIERVEGATPTKWDIQVGTSHNTYLTILAEIGAVGFFFYAFPAIWWLYLTLRVLPRLPKEGFWSSRLLIMMWLSVGFHIVVSQFVDMRFFFFSLALLWLTLGLIANMVQPYLKPSDIGAPEWAIKAAGLELRS